MPLPKPKSGEAKNKFMDRCMANPTMNKEYSDNDQRYAICQSLWKQKRGAGAMQIERRYMPVQELRVAKDDDGNRQIVGLAAVFDKFSENLGGFVERIEQGAFKEALKKSDTRALFNHDSNLVLGRKSAKTLRVKETNEGLAVDISPPDTQFARDLQVSIERGDIQGMSFGFNVASNGDSWEETDDGRTIRTITNISELPDVSVVTFPAYPDTTVALRSLEEWRTAHTSDSGIEIDPEDDTQKHGKVDSADAHAAAAMQRKQELYQRHLNARKTEVNHD